jgi:hypothetical protein
VVASAGSVKDCAAIQARCGRLQYDPSRQMRPCRISIAVSRCWARLRSASTAARTRARSRTASSAGAGTRTGVSSPARCSRASRIASRLSVLTRSDPPLGISDGATTSHATPIEASSRYRS